MEHYIFYCKLSLLAVLSLITACCMLSRRWYVNLAAFLACLSGETFLAYLFFPGYMLCPAAASFIILFLSRIWDLSRTPAKGNGADPIRLPVRSGIRESRLEFHYHYSNFLVYGGAGSGKTKSIGKWLLSEYMRLGFAGFIYDFKDTDYTRTAYNLIKRHRYPHKFYYVSFDRPERSYRFNPLKVVRDRTELIQLMEDVLLALLPKKEQQNLVSEMLAGAYLKAEGSEKTQASYLSTLCNNLATISQNEEIAYVLSGDDFDFNLIDPENPKLFAVSNNFSKNSVYAPVISMLMTISARQFSMQNRVPFVYFLDEMTTVNIKNFETLPSVLREYKAAFILLTQSGAKLENLYGKLDRSSVEANFGNMFLGRTKDVEALKYYPLFFGKEEKERRSRSSGKSGASSSSSVTVSSQKEDIYQGKDFADLEPGEFIGSATRANVSYFKVKLEMYDDRNEEPLPDVRVLEPGELGRNFARILEEVRELFPCE